MPQELPTAILARLERIPNDLQIAVARRATVMDVTSAGMMCWTSYVCLHTCFGSSGEQLPPDPIA